MKRRATNEAQIENTRRFVRAYGELAGYVDRIDDLQHRLVATYKAAVESAPTYGTIGSILERSSSRSESISRKAAWIASHQLNSRTFGVGNFVVQSQGGRSFSPLIKQVDRLGHEPRPVNYKSFLDKLEERPWERRFDGILVDPGDERITVVKGCSLAAAPAIKRRKGTYSGPNLWVPRGTPPARRVSPKKLAALTLAEFVLSSAFPDFQVDTILVVMNTDEGAWDFEGFRSTGTPLRHLDDVAGDLSCLPTVWHGDVSGVGRTGTDYLDQVPLIPASNDFNRLPVDRATRCRMILEYMWSVQSASDDLTGVTVAQIADAISRRHLLWYTHDWRRHDLEDCLAMGGFIERPRYASKQYVLTPLGVFEALVARQQMRPAATFASEKDVTSYLLSAVHRQARLWARYSEGEQVLATSQG